jgi:hypothetical protein
MTMLMTSLLALLAAYPAAGVSPSPWSHLRPLSPHAATLIADGATRVPAVRSLLTALEATDVVIYLSHSMPLSPGEPQGYTRFVSHAAGTRYLFVQINCWELPERERLVLLGHELQHALEIAAAPEVLDEGGIERLYRRIGYEAGRRGRFESPGARAMSDRVRDELARRR